MPPSHLSHLSHLFAIFRPSQGGRAPNVIPLPSAVLCSVSCAQLCLAPALPHSVRLRLTTGGPAETKPTNCGARPARGSQCIFFYLEGHFMV